MTNSPRFSLTFTGTGGVHAAPLFGCQCPACQRARTMPKHLRRPCSALIDCEGELTLLDAGLDDLSQRFHPGQLQRILLTHYHMDHVHGLFPLRWGKGTPIPVYSPPDPVGCDDLFKHPGILDFQFLKHPFQAYPMGNMRVTPVPLNHSRITWGYVISWRHSKIAYLTDTRGLPANTYHFLSQQKITCLIIDCTYPPGEQRNHNDINQATELYYALRPGRMLLTHIDHTLDEWLITHRLPTGMAVAQDNQTLCLD
ncbi:MULTISPECIES: phosphonate metabolism protein PhnP [unclassified Brenneria]|uniref:phosphonate metabolism protein PhnP n=1 Tax=unclassified Brenneria TaxID=2634434 RepID=UPI001552F3BC|nr:phosphonate metabolism protein PhnP [Brenneria sp. hezel4-2-4]MEE3650577.1 phosphonate metabolism protein PhnP [Brenneria sp. HEZEL_4_2_4]NPD00532.1 phosphonate metabolism protein PhnP [Brenneria sp. hezel4-2-4]